MNDDRQSAFAELVAEVADPVRRYVWRRTDPATADDVVSETLIVLWRRLEEVPEERVPWSIGVARLQLANADRSRRRSLRLVARIARVDPPAEVSRSTSAAADDPVRAVLEQLRDTDAELLRLWIWEELEPRHIAVVLGISTNAATVRLHRARNRFSDAWRKSRHADGHVAVKEGDNE